MRWLFPNGFRNSTLYWWFVGYGCFTWPFVLVVAGLVLLVASPWLSSGWAWAGGVLAAVVLAVVIFFVLLIVAAARTKRAWQEANYPKGAAGEPQDATHPATQQPAQDRPADRP